jgi:hypothetical protein
MKRKENELGLGFYALTEEAKQRFTEKFEVKIEPSEYFGDDEMDDVFTLLPTTPRNSRPQREEEGDTPFITHRDDRITLYLTLVYLLV